MKCPIAIMCDTMKEWSSQSTDLDGGMMCRYEVMLKDAESEKLEMLSHEVLNVLADERNYKFAANVRHHMWSGLCTCRCMG